MNRQQLIFDDQGRSWPTAGPHLATSLGCALAPADLREYVLKNLGFIELTRGASGAEVKFRRGKVSEVALTSLLFWLADNPQDRIIITSLEREWHHELVVGNSALLRRLEKLVAFTTLSARERFFSESIGHKDLAAKGAHARLYEGWLQGNLRDRASLESFCDHWFDRRFTIVKVWDGEQLRIDTAGGGYDCYQDDYIERAHGSRLEDEPDWQYGQWIAQTHWNVLRNDAPAIHNVDADIGPTGATRRRYTYRRVLLPFTENGDQFVLTASLPEPGLSLRSVAA